MKIKIVLVNALLCLALANPASAASKSVTFQVSCSIKPIIELSALDAQSVEARSNLENQYRMTEDLRDQAGQKIKLYSLTAL